MQGREAYYLNVICYSSPAHHVRFRASSPFSRRAPARIMALEAINFLAHNFVKC